MLSQLDGSESMKKLGQYGNVLADAIRKQQQQRNKITTEEMRAVLKDRDDAVNRVRLINKMRQKMMKHYEIIETSVQDIRIVKGTSLSKSFNNFPLWK